jgi:hypothetical protein
MSRARAAEHGCGIRYRHLIRKHRLTTPDKRAKTLGRLGFASYRDYLKSPLWKLIRAAKLDLDPVCEVCGQTKANAVHHLRYNENTLRGKDSTALVSVCSGCHREIEFKEDGTKRTYEAAMKLTKKLLRKRGRWESHKRTRPAREADGLAGEKSPPIGSTVRAMPASSEISPAMGDTAKDWR